MKLFARGTGPAARRGLLTRMAAWLTAWLTACATFALASPACAADKPLNVVAAENFYGDVIAQLGGAHVAVSSILNSPDQDPHLFEASPKTARALQAADLVVYNGVDYDPWMEKLLAASQNKTRATIVVGALVGKKRGDNPHLWYDPATMPAVARAVATALEAKDPAHKADYDANLARFLDTMKPLQAEVAQLRKGFAGQPVTATEPVAGYLTDALGLTTRNARFQLAVMNDTEPSAADIAAFEDDLKQRRVKVLVYNSQATEALTKRMLALARQSGVPVVSVTETQPAGKTFQQWMTSQLAALAQALQGKKQ
jgi:zinc/manganese transport system substrate-binding protein